MEILTAVIIVGVIALICGVGLSVASVIMSVPTDETVTAVRNKLPGANCGACGYSGCDGYAEALAKGEAKPGLCSPGGESVNKKIAEILGVDSETAERKTAFVMCNGNCENTEKKYIYEGINSCAAVNMLYGGDGSCGFGCLGYGDCVSVCKFSAISVQNGVAAVDKNLCTACGMCVGACPKKIIETVPFSKTFGVLCSNKDKGAVTRKVCKTGCIGCMKCQKVCEFGAITVNNNVAKIDYSKCTDCGKCAENCPVNAIEK